MDFINVVAVKINEEGYPIQQEIVLCKFDNDKKLLILPEGYTLPWLNDRIWYKPRFNLSTGMWEEDLNEEQIKEYKEKVKKEQEENIDDRIKSLEEKIEKLTQLLETK